MVQHGTAADVRLLGNILCGGAGITKIMEAFNSCLQDSCAGEVTFSLLPGELALDPRTGFACQVRALDVE